MPLRRKREDAGVSVGPYREAILGIQTQFELIRFALHNLPKSRIKAFYKHRVESEMKASEESFAQFEKFAPEFGEIKADLLEFEHKQLRRRYKPSDIRIKKEVSEDSLNQSELLLLVAHFESFMKLVHETFLKAAPHRVFGNSFRGAPNATLSLGEVFDSSASHWDSRKVVTEMTAKEVKWLDTQSVEKRAAYFEKNFGASFGTSVEINELKEIFRLRNQISHHMYSPPAKNLNEVKERPFVSDETLGKTRSFFTSIPRRCIDVGTKAHSAYFRGY